MFVFEHARVKNKYLELLQTYLPTMTKNWNFSEIHHFQQQIRYIFPWFTFRVNENCLSIPRIQFLFQYKVRIFVSSYRKMISPISLVTETTVCILDTNFPSLGSELRENCFSARFFNGRSLTQYCKKTWRRAYWQTEWGALSHWKKQFAVPQAIPFQLHKA